MVAFYAPDELWYAAKVKGIYPGGKQQTLPDGTVVTLPYYVVTFMAYPGQPETLYGDSLRIPPPKLKAQAVHDLDDLFAAIDADGARL